MSQAHAYLSKKAKLQDQIFNLDLQFPTEDAYLELFYQLVKEDLECGACHGSEFEWRYGTRMANCLPCHRTVHLTANTVFSRMRKSRPWMLAIRLLEAGYSFSAAMFADIVGMSRSAASVMLKKVFMVVSRQMEEKAALLNSGTFLQVMCRRSIQTPAAKHPVTEQDVIDELVSEDLENSSIDRIFEEFQMTEKDKKTYLFLSTTPTVFEDLVPISGLSVPELSSSLGMLELVGLIERLPGNRYKQYPLPSASPSQQVNPSLLISAVTAIGFIMHCFDGISRKNLQLYLAAYWCFIDPDRWREGALLKACFRSPPICYNELLWYVSPPMVQLCAANG